jgi:prepilin-type N-terminal cleavage/methylation domain-containing protein
MIYFLIFFRLFFLIPLLSFQQIRDGIRGNRGFTIVELLVVVSITSVLSMVILFDHQRFNSHFKTSSLAYDVAITVRQAQIYGMSVRQHDAVFTSGYGVHFPADGSRFIFFADNSGSADYVYQSSDDAILEEYIFPEGYSASKMCGVRVAGGSGCYTLANALNIVFVRPNFNARILDDLGQNYTRAEITFTSRRGDERLVIVESSGQISVQ